MARIDRLLAGPGFAVFTQRAAFAAEVLGEYLERDPALRHLVYIHHAETATELTTGITEACRSARLELVPVLWEGYGAPANVARVAALAGDHLAIVSADHHRTVGNRLDVRRSYVRRTRARKKIVIDSVPYEVAPWRVFFPFAFFDRALLGYHHSYAIEQDYEAFLDGHLPENPCRPARIALAVWRAAVVDGHPVFERRPEVTELEASAGDQAAYVLERDRLFATEKSIVGVKSKLSRWIQARYPARAIPLDLRRVYSPGLPPIVHTSLPFDRWLAGEVLGLMNHTDALLGHLALLAAEAGG